MRKLSLTNDFLGKTWVLGRIIALINLAQAVTRPDVCRLGRTMYKIGQSAGYPHPWFKK